jgi:hypothetical protein
MGAEVGLDIGDTVIADSWKAELSKGMIEVDRH